MVKLYFSCCLSYWFYFLCCKFINKEKSMKDLDTILRVAIAAIVAVIIVGFITGV